MWMFLLGFFLGALSSLFIFALCNAGERNLSSTVIPPEDETIVEDKIQTP